MDAPENLIPRFNDISQAVEHMLALSMAARRSIDILTQSLSPELYCDDKLVNAISKLARKSAASKVRILAKDTRPLRGISHSIVSLARRLPSHIEIKQLIEDRSRPDTAFLCVDEKHLVFFNSESEHAGFARNDARVESKHFIEQFSNDWQRNSKTDINLRVLAL